MSEANVPSDYRTAPEPRPVAERDTIIPSFYNATEHKDLSAVVTENGMPIAVNGEVLTLGMVPHERRWAIGSVVDGAAEVLPKERFLSDFRMYYEEDLRFKGARPVFPDLWPSPASAREWVSWKVTPHDVTRLVPLGVPFGREVVRPSTVVYDKDTDRVLTRDAWKEEVAKAEARGGELEKLRAELEALKAGGRDPAPIGDEEPKESRPRKKYTLSPEARAAAAERMKRTNEARRARKAGASAEA